MISYILVLSIGEDIWRFFILLSELPSVNGGKVYLKKLAKFSIQWRNIQLYVHPVPRISMKLYI